MVNTTEQILLTLGARNNASSVFGQVDKDAKSMASSISSTISNLNNGLMNIGSVTDNMMQGLTGKSAMDNILGTTSKAETNKVLIGMMTETEEAADSLFKTVDEVTNDSLTSMQDLIPAMNAFSSATGASDKDLESVTDEMANFGAAVLAQTGSTDLAQQSMMDLSKGIKGAFASLDQYGVSEDALMRTGLWSGKEDDVKGYMAAVEKVIGSTDELMQTNQGLDALIGKAFSRGGKKIGNEFLPVIKDIKRGFIDLDHELDGNLTASMLAVSGGVEVMNQGLWNVSTTVNGIKDLKEGLIGVKDIASDITSAFKNASKSAETLNTSMGAVQVVGETTDIADDLFKVQEVTPEIEQAAAHAGAGFGYNAESTLDELEKYASSQKTAEADALKLLDEAQTSNEAINTKKLEYLSNCEDMMGDVTIASKGLDAVDDVDDLAKATGGIAEAGLEIGSAGGEMAASSVAIEETAVATTSLSASFTSMIVPLLAISAVIAVMIPIAAGLAAEALVFLKAIQMVFDALDFGGINLEDDISGIKQLAEGLAWVGVAMGAMTFTSIMTGLAVITSGFLGITGPLKIAIGALTEAASLLDEFSTVNIDSSVPDNIKNISESLNSVSSAMLALTGTTITAGFSNFVAWVFDFSSTTDALGQAKQDLIKASSAINELASGIEPLPKEDAAKIQNVCDSLASVGDAIGALRSIRDGQNWDDIFGGLMEGLFGEGVDIQQALSNVKGDIQNAATALSEWTDLPEIPKGIGEKVKTISDTLTSLSESFEALRGLRDSVNLDDFVGGIFGGQDIQGALSSIKKELFYTANNLKGLEALPPVSEDIGTKVKTINDTVSSVSEAAKGLTTVPDMGDYDPANLSTAVTNVQKAATELTKLNETTFNGDAANGVLSSINTTIETLKTTLSGASGFSTPATNIGTEIVNGVKSGLSPLTSTITGEISAATTSSASTGWTGGAYIGQSTTGGLKSALQLKSTMDTEVSYALTAMTSRTQEFYDAGAALGKAANEGFQSNNAINPGSPGNLAHVMMDEVGYILGAMTDNYGVARKTASGLGASIYQGFGNPNLGLNSTDMGMTADDLNALNTITSKVPQNQGSKTIIMYNNVTVDARNKTEKEAKSIMTLALEGMDNITDINVDV
ncbi:hypothetical protein [Methanobrevibacter sp.]